MNTLPVAVSPQARLAESILQRRLRRLDDGLQAFGKYVTDAGRRLLLLRDYPGIAFFVECVPDEQALDGVRFFNGPLNGRYGRTDPRPPAVSADSRLGKGCEAFQIECLSPSALGRFIDWYENQ